MQDGDIINIDVTVYLNVSIWNMNDLNKHIILTYLVLDFGCWLCIHIIWLTLFRERGFNNELCLCSYIVYSIPQLCHVFFNHNRKARKGKSNMTQRFIVHSFYITRNHWLSWLSFIFTGVPWWYIKNFLLWRCWWKKQEVSSGGNIFLEIIVKLYICPPNIYS